MSFCSHVPLSDSPSLPENEQESPALDDWHASVASGGGPLLLPLESWAIDDDKNKVDRIKPAIKCFIQTPIWLVELSIGAKYVQTVERYIYLTT